MGEENIWYVYMLECGDGSLYTGVTTDLSRRVTEHREGRGAKYTKMKGVRDLVYHEQRSTKSEALQREAAIKHMSRKQKQLLLEDKK